MPANGPLDHVDLLDLCILAYQLHTQTLVFAPDPYVESVDGRSDHFKNLKKQLSFTGNPFASERLGRRGIIPNIDGWKASAKLDPVLSSYDRINPGLPGIVHQEPKGKWIVYDVPKHLTAEIGDVSIASYDIDNGPDSPRPRALLSRQPQRAAVKPGGKDSLYAFEGATGKVRWESSASWSVMGYVLVRRVPNTPAAYDVIVAFRGSRSGKVRPVEWLGRRGNPDWATDTAVHSETVAPVSGYALHAGFGNACRAALPTIKKCIDDIVATRGGPPDGLYVTGHSLGGALAVCFASAIANGRSTPATNSPVVPANWPRPQVVTSGAPAVGPSLFTDWLNVSVPIVAYRHRGDQVAGAMSKLRPGSPSWPRAGVVVKMGKDATTEFAHSPQNIRKELQQFMRVYGRAVDTEAPWTETTVDDVLSRLVRPQPGLEESYRFRDGLRLYLSAYSLVNDDLPSAVAACDAALVQWKPIAGTAALAKIGSDLLTGVPSLNRSSPRSTLAAWLALIALEDGFDWSRNQPQLDSLLALT